MIDFSPHISNLTSEMQWWLNQILEILTDHSEMSQSQAINAMLGSSSMIAVKQNPTWLLRESPFYWAMEILEGREGPKGPNSPYWWQDPRKHEEFEKYENWFHSLSAEERSVNFA